MSERDDRFDEQWSSEDEYTAWCKRKARLRTNPMEDLPLDSDSLVEGLNKLNRAIRDLDRRLKRLERQ